MQRISILVPGVVLAFAALTACGGGGSGGGTDTATQTSPAAPTTSSAAPDTSSMAATPGSASPTSQSASGESGSEAPSAKALIVIKNFTFMGPESVQAGATITVRNEDRVTHTVTADNGKFDVNVPAGSEVTFTAPKQPGSYGYHCTPHPYMTATLEVT